MARASEALLDALHDSLAKTLADAVKDPECPASTLAVAAKFLRDNGVAGVATEDNPLGQLADSLPDTVDLDNVVNFADR